jgi:hypothetical protein
MNRSPIAVTLAAAITLASGCGIQTDSAPRDVPPENRARLSGVSVGGVASGAERIYLVGPGDDRLLRSVPRDPSAPDKLIDLLFLGPNTDERNAGLATNIPTSAGVLSIDTQGSKMVLDVSDDLLTVTGDALVHALAQIVYTASEIEGIESVEIRVDGDRQAWPTSDRPTLEPLTLYDYPGIARSAQPSYPSVPSGA